MKLNGNDNSISEFRKFINTLRCPLCQAQLDGNIHPKQAVVYCVSNNDEYDSTWIPGNIIPSHETIRHYYPQYEYAIGISRFDYDMYRTIVVRYNRDTTNFYKESTKKVLFNVPKRILLFRERIEEKDLLNKIKLFNLFS